MADISIASRLVIRKEFTLFLRKSMSTPKNVVDHVPANFQDQSPLVCVYGAPTRRDRESPTAYLNRFGLNIRLVTIYFMDNSPDWTPSMAEDMLDTLEYEASLALLAADQQSKNHSWASVERTGWSYPEPPVKINGVSYLSETITVQIEVSDG